MFASRITQSRSGNRIFEGVALLLFISAPANAQAPASGAAHLNPWSVSQVIQPAELGRELSEHLKAEIVCVGFDALYRTAHISGATYHGPASKSEGLEDLKKWVRDLPRGQRIVLYCGCCPMDRCPNIRPAFQALKEMGFTRLGVLSIPQDLKRDWVDKGFPVEKAR